MVYTQARPGNVIEDIREEFDLSPDRASHVSWLINNGMLNAQDVRAMLSRQSLVETHGLDMNEWPALQSKPQKGLMQQAREERARKMPLSHRGEGSLPAAPRRLCQLQRLRVQAQLQPRHLGKRQRLRRTNKENRGCGTSMYLPGEG